MGAERLPDVEEGRIVDHRVVAQGQDPEAVEVKRQPDGPVQNPGEERVVEGVAPEPRRPLRGHADDQRRHGHEKDRLRRQQGDPHRGLELRKSPVSHDIADQRGAEKPGVGGRFAGALDDQPAGQQRGEHRESVFLVGNVDPDGDPDRGPDNEKQAEPKLWVHGALPFARSSSRLQAASTSRTLQ